MALGGGNKAHNNINNCQIESNPSRVQQSNCSLLTIGVPENRQQAMRRLLRPFTKQLRSSCKAVNIMPQDANIFQRFNHQFSNGIVRPSHKEFSDEIISSPAIAVTLFLPEISHSTVHKIKSKFRKPPWQLHHSIQLQHRTISNIILGKQEYYFMSRSFPLWSVSDSPSQDTQCLRITIFVSEFKPMVEFYRLLTGSEMEATKPGFCLFQLNTDLYTVKQPSPLTSSISSLTSSSTSSLSSSSLSCLSSSTDLSSISSILSSPNSASSSASHNYLSPNNFEQSFPTKFELVLKLSPNIQPVLLQNALLTFPVNDIMPFYTILNCPIEPLNTTDYLITDPDGNRVILHDLSKQIGSDNTMDLNQMNYTHHVNPTDQNHMKNAHVNLFDQNHMSYIHDSIQDSCEMIITDIEASISKGLQSTTSQNRPNKDKRHQNKADSFDSGRYSDFETSCSI